MEIMKLSAIFALGLSVSACSSLDTVSRSNTLDLPALDAQQQMVQRSYAISAVNFGASPDLRVSEANSYYPIADVVWRGDPIGNRVEQIGTIFNTAMAEGTARLDGNIPVVVDLQLLRFHGVTERTRFSIGGVYNIEFLMTVRNAVTGAIIEAPREIQADLAAPGGAAAIIAEQQGQTEKVRVTNFLTQILRDELTGNYSI